MKDHYQILEIGPKASREEIKKSFRRLAHEFHPDKNPSNPFSEARFREIHEAYTVLSDDDRRAMYDYERWLSGKFRGNAVAITPAYLLQELRKLEAHLAQIDVYRMNRQLLHEYLLFLLQDEKVGIIQLKARPEELSGLVRSFMHITALLPPYYSRPVLERLLLIAEGYPEEQETIRSTLRRESRKEKLDRYFPWLALLLTLLLCMAMYLFARHR